MKTTFITTMTDITDDLIESTITTVPTIESSSIIIPSSTLFNNLSVNTDRSGSTETYYTTELPFTNIGTETNNFITSTKEMEEITKTSLDIEYTTIVHSKLTDSYDTTQTPISATEAIINEYSTFSPFFTNYPTEIKNNIDNFSTTSIFEENTSEELTTTSNWDAVTTVSTDNITKILNCMETPCFNGGSCVNTSVGSRVSFL